MRRPDFVTSESIVTAAQWSALAEYMRWAYLQLPQTTLLMATSGTTGNNATSSFTTGTTIFNVATGTATANIAYVPVLCCTSGISSGFANRGKGEAQTNADNVPVPLVASDGVVQLPTSTAYFSGASQCACTVAVEGNWMEDA